MITVATHNGHFHADEVFAVAILRLSQGDISVARTRDPRIFSKADIKVDIGLRYDPENGFFDHHQKEGAGKRANSIPFASAGLVWKHYGRELVNSDKAFSFIDEKLISPIDAGDNGVSTFEPIIISPFLISDVIESFNPNWNEEKDSDDAFGKAVSFAISLLQRLIRKANSFLEADRIISSAEILEEGRIIVLDKGIPWERPVIEKGWIDFVVLPDSSGGWYVYTVPVKQGSFDRKMYLPEGWAAKNGQELIDATGVKDAYFCHRDRFIAGARTREGAIQLARLALKNHTSS